MENQDYYGILGNRCCPYENRLAASGILFSNYTGVAYPSKPNYLAFAGGSTFGQAGSDNPFPLIGSDSLFHQLSQAGISWAAWAESYPGDGRCALVPSAPRYLMRHVAPLLFADVANTPLCDRVTAVEPFRLPQFLWVTPNTCDDDHNCPPAVGDKWLAEHVPAWITEGAQVFIAYDTARSGGQGGGGHVFAVLAGKTIRHRTDMAEMNHYSALAGVERAFGLPLLRQAASATPVPFSSAPVR